MFTFLIQSSICLASFYVIYRGLLADQRLFQWNRFFLLGALVVSVIIPWLAPYLTFSDSPIVAFHWSTIMEEIVVTPDREPLPKMTHIGSLFTVLHGVYLSGVVFVFARFAYGLGKIFHYYRGGSVIRKDGYTIVVTGKRHLPFSFFRYIFIDSLNADEDARAMIEHEKVHIRQKHSLDVLFVELFGILFWFHPMLRMYKREIRQVHECLADEAVCRVIDTRQYIGALLRKPSAYFEAGLGHTFYQSHLKKRLHMMTKINYHGKTRWVYLVSVPVLAGLVMFFSNPLAGRFTMPPEAAMLLTDTVPKPPKAPAAPSSPSNVRKQKAVGEVAPPLPPPPPPPPPKPPVAGEPVVEEMPRYYHPECEGLSTKKEKENCAGSQLIRYIGENLVYPEAARKDSIEGMVVVQFIVKPDGSMSDLVVIKDIGRGCGEAVLNVLKPLAGRKNVWVAGKDKGKKVSVAQTLPVRFALN